jgi:steroid 5-alpha reductase family enzyme
VSVAKRDVTLVDSLWPLSFLMALRHKVSGVALLEKNIALRRPAYRDDIERTNAFIPGPPRAGRQGR